MHEQHDPERQPICRSVRERPGPDGALSLEQLANRITELAAHIDAASYRLLVLIAEFDQRQGWAPGGFLSCAHFLSVLVGVDPVTAREKVRVANALVALPRISEAMSRGEISYSKVRAMTRIATPENEGELLTMARSAPASHIERVVREYRRVGQLELGKTQRQQEVRYLNAYYDEAGMLVLDGRLPPEVGAVVLEALEGAKKALRASAEASRGAGEPRSRAERSARPRACSTPRSRVAPRLRAHNETAPEKPAQLRADALGLLAERALPALGTAERGEPYQVMLHVDAQVLADPEAQGECCIEHGPAIGAETARRITCDAPVVAMVQDARGEPLSIGRKSRRVSTALYRVLRSRDRTCVYPGCERTGQLQVHHVRHWADGGATDRTNTCLLCSAHHQSVHEGGVRVEQTDQGLVFHTSAGFPISARQEPPALPDDPVGALIKLNEEQGLQIGPRTNGIRWWGEALDSYWAVETLRMKDRRAAGRVA